MRKHRPYYGDAVKLPYLYFPVIIKDVGVIRPEEKLPEADFYVLVCGGKWWEIDRTVNAAKILKKPWECNPALQSYGEKSTSETSKSFI